MPRLGFVTLINTVILANDGGPQYKQVREVDGNKQATQFIEMGIGWRLYDEKHEMPTLKTFDPEAARILKEQREARERSEMERLQTRMTQVIQAGGIPDLTTLKTLSDAEFQAQLAELKPAELVSEKDIWASAVTPPPTKKVK